MIGQALLLLAVASFVWAEVCPPMHSGSQCQCIKGQETKVVCRSITDVQSLSKEIQRYLGHSIDVLKLVEVQLPHLPNNLFVGTSVKKIFIEESFLDNLYNVSDGQPAPFNGLQKSLEEIHIESTVDPSKWYWPDMKDFKKVKVFSTVLSPLNFVGHYFAEIGGGSLESITATYSNVYRIHPQAFPELTGLKEANFAGNYVPYLVRTMFPNPAPNLKLLNFRDNSLFTLPEDMFSNMPALEFLDFSQNAFKTFQNVVFNPVWSQLHSFYIGDNPLKCDCSLLRLKQKLDAEQSFPNNDLDTVTCTNQGDFKKTLLKYLDFGGMQCQQ